jgi:hypothetical protein
MKTLSRRPVESSLGYQSRAKENRPVTAEFLELRPISIPDIKDTDPH